MWANEAREMLLNEADLSMESRRILEAMTPGRITFHQRIMLSRLKEKHFPLETKEARDFRHQVEAIRREAQYGEKISEPAAQRDPAIPLGAEGAESEAIGSSKQAK